MCYVTLSKCGYVANVLSVYRVRRIASLKALYLSVVTPGKITLLSKLIIYVAHRNVYQFISFLTSHYEYKVAIN